jgi:N-acetylmuramoyl-L-alanine amidase
MSKATSARKGRLEIMRSILQKTIRERRPESKRGRRTAAHVTAALAAVLLSACVSNVRNTQHTFHTVVIDPGHGGRDPGTRSSHYMSEKDAALDIALRLDQRMRAAGFNTVLTRKDDTFISLDDRVRISNRQENAIFVSVHLNESRPRPDVHGVETYYTSPQSTELAQKIIECVATVPGEASRGIHASHLHVLRLNLNPAVLVECGYFSNRGEAKRFANPAYREAVAAAIAQALIAEKKK